MRRIRISVILTALACSALAQQDPAALAARGMQLQQSGDYAAAAETYRALLKQQPNEVAAHVNLGVVLVNLGQFDGAIAEYQAAYKLVPADPRIALNLALAYQKSGRLKQATERFEALHAAQPQDRKVAMLLADCYLQSGRNDGVIAVLEPLKATNADDLGFDYLLGMALLRTQRIAEGQALLDRILRDGDSAEARFLLGTRMFESGDFPAAVKQFASAAELNPKLPELQSYYGRALLNIGDPDPAATAFQKELASNPADYAANLGLGQILTVRKQFTDAEPLLRQAVTLRPESPDAKLALAECLNGSGRFQAARPLAESAIAAFPQSPESHSALAASYAGLHLTAQATRERKIATELQSAADKGPRPGDLAPDFELPETANGNVVQLSAFRGKSPVVLVFGSYTCPNFRDSADALRRLQTQYGTRIPFLLVYIREAHTGGDWQSARNVRQDIDLAPAADLAQKQDHALMCSRKLHLPFTSVVDGMDNAVESAYNAWPARAFVVGRDGRILYSSRLTELDFHEDDLAAVLREQTATTERSIHD